VFLRAAAVLALLGTALSVAPPALAGEPSIGDCLLAAEASLKLRGEHKLRLTRTQLLVCSAPSCPAEVRQECMKRIDEVNAASPTIVLAVKSGGKEMSAVNVTVDGQLLADHLDGSALSVDPGAHEFTFEAKGLPPLTETIILHEGEKDRRETVILGGGPKTPAPSSSDNTATTVPTEGETVAPKDEDTGNTQRVLGIVTGGVGVAGLAVGSVFGVFASSAWNKAKTECSSGTDCPSNAMNDRSSALTDATVSTVGFIAGGVLAVGGVVLFLTAPRADGPKVGLEARPNGFAVTGQF
jgi:hypothetical protein